MSTVMAVVAFAALLVLLVTTGVMTRYAMEVRRAAERVHGEVERALFWSEVS